MFFTRRGTLVLSLAVVCGPSLAAALAADPITFELTVDAGDRPRTNVPVRVDVQLPPELAGATTARLEDASGTRLVGQLTPPALMSPPSPAGGGPGQVARELHFVVPQLAAHSTLTLTATIAPSAPDDDAPGFAWVDTANEHAELSFAGRPVLRYMCAPLDDSSPAARAATFKVYHHLYDPQGQRLVTKGPGGLFPHHRGLFFGFNRIRYGNGKTADTWHCNQGESQAHQQFLESAAGPVLGRHRLEIEWRGKDQQGFATEQRELTAYHVPGGTLVEFASRLESKVGPVSLDGDPQHAGFQFRASQEVPDKTARLTYYLRPDGQGQPGKFRNWPDDKSHVNLPWNALSFVLGDQRYTCCYLDRPANPKEARFSERDYGRFGAYFPYELDAGKPLELNYRIWLQEGEMTVDQVAALAADFVAPPQVKLTKR